MTYIDGHDVLHPDTPPPPPPETRSVQSVPWHLARVRGRKITLTWISGTCDPNVPPDAGIDVVETSRSITIRVPIHVVTTSGAGTACGGVGLFGTLSTTLHQPLAGRRILHGLVTDHED